MSIHPSIESYLKSKFLADLDQRAIRDVLGMAEVRRAPAKHAILEAGRPATSLFMLNKGRVRYYLVTKGARESMLLDTSKSNEATMLVGKHQWPMPVPIVKRGGKWYFDAKAGHDEVVFRRVGANELDAIQICHGFVDAQREYASEAHDGVNQYAQRIISTSGKTDGLYWKNDDGTSGGPISEAIAKALAEGYEFSEPTAYHGYYFKILKGQGAAGPLGRVDYVIDGIMIGGFALVAVPAEYRVTGVKTFIVSNDGVVYQKDLGPNSLGIAKKIELYDPDKTWQPTDDQWESAESNE